MFGFLSGQSIKRWLKTRRSMLDLLLSLQLLDRIRERNLGHVETGNRIVAVGPCGSVGQNPVNQILLVL